ncbi:DUF4157 domain-containing protein [Massilia sp. DJPM01]|uniref:DUF4157 domain-containing protein n=1 Tax=Massilia sp. DJPM01 TaxID=3024404 RepID=UPI00259D6D44|nr:DUF4157 domain-containing protein [Massilia sp. DJPM01]MDM5180521.1 DUF4157 domain-containing protein [Massilia sp. DJPM01]
MKTRLPTQESQTTRTGVDAQAHAAGPGTLQQMANDSARVRRQLSQAELITAGARQRGMPPAQRRQSGGQGRTGLPPQLKAGVESLSGLAMDHVNVHYNSTLPAQLHAHAYAQGSEIHLGHGQEKHLPHEAWHVVQQAQGRVKPTMQLRDAVAVNDDAGLEHEADIMGAKAMQQQTTAAQVPAANVAASPSPPLQLMRFARFSGWWGLNPSSYTSAEKKLNALEEAAVAAVNKALGQMHKQHGQQRGSTIVLDDAYHQRGVLLTDALSGVRDSTVDADHYADAEARLNKVVTDAYDVLVELRTGHNKKAADQVTRHVLSDIPKEKLWKTYLDRKYHKEAVDSNSANPGMLFDSQQSPGYQQSMLEALAPMLAPSRPSASAEEEKEPESPREQLNYESYTALHDAVIKYTADPEKMKKLGGREEFSQFGTPEIPDGQGLERLERLAALHEARQVMISDTPLLAEALPSTAREDQPKAITLHSQDGGGGHMDTNYSQADGKLLVNAILKLYYEGRFNVQENDAKLKRIVTTIRSLHIGHFFGDANGRLHMFVMLNRFLVEEGFSPAILPHGPDVFGGLATVDALVADVLEGMQLFHKETL